MRRLLVILAAAVFAVACGGDGDGNGDCWTPPTIPDFQAFRADGSEICLPPPSQEWGDCFPGGWTSLEGGPVLCEENTGRPGQSAIMLLEGHAEEDDYVLLFICEPGC